MYEFELLFKCLASADYVLQKIFAWWNQKTPREFWLDRLAGATTYEEYEDAAFQLDAVLGNDLWYVVTLPPTIGCVC